jgi:ubiquinone/menaquinone biosynthesis C-methylase UbiE
MYKYADGRTPREVYEQLHAADQWYSCDARCHGRGLEPLVVGKSLLDVGCGRTLFVNEFPELKCTVLDISQPVIDDMRRAGITAIRGEVQHLPFADNEFDSVCAFDILEHVPPDELAQAITELKRVASLRVLITIGKRSHVHTGTELHLSLMRFAEWREMLHDEKWVIIYDAEHWSNVSYMFVLEASPGGNIR